MQFPNWTEQLREWSGFFVKPPRIDNDILANREITLQNQLHSIPKRFDVSYFDVLVIFVIAGFMAYLQPFGTGKSGALYSWGFWVTICFCGYFIYKPLTIMGSRILSAWHPFWIQRPWLTLVILTFIASVIMSLLSPLIVLAFFDLPVGYSGLLLQSAVMSLFLGGIITLIQTLQSLLSAQNKIIRKQQQQISQVQEKVDSYCHEGAEQLLSNVPEEKRGELLCLQIDDHYLNIHTDQGSHLILMRFKDALLLVKDYPGVQTHRSWWVAVEAISSYHKDGRRFALTLSNGMTVPVSKKYVESVKKAMN